MIHDAIATSSSSSPLLIAPIDAAIVSWLATGWLERAKCLFALLNFPRGKEGEGVSLTPLLALARRGRLPLLGNH